MEIASHIRAVAQKLLGDPTSKTSTELRYRRHGSLAIDIKKGTWFDHEAGEGGGVLDLIKRECGLSSRDAVAWLKEQLGIELADAAPGPPRSNGAQQHRGGLGKVVATYVYRDDLGDPRYRVVRFDPKNFRQERYDPKGKTYVRARGCMDGVELLPYRLDEWAAELSLPIVVVEGEKDVDRLFTLGIPATCNPGGVGKWPTSFARYFDGRDVIILPDNDTAGRKHAAIVASSLREVASQVRILELPGLPDKGDVSDWLDLLHHEPDALDKALERQSRIVDDALLIRLGRGDPPPQPFSYLSHSDLHLVYPPRPYLIEHLIPAGVVTSLYGEGGTGKSFLALVIGMHVAARRELIWQRFACTKHGPVLLFMCEDDEQEIRRRRNRIARSMGVVGADLGDRLLITSRTGQNNVLMTFPGGNPTRSAVFDQLIAEIERIQPVLTILDNAAQVYAGNENERSEVTQFLNALYLIPRVTGGGSVLLLGHPPKTHGSQYSGSTAWDAGVRQRLFFKRLTDDDGNDADDRYSLEVLKTNSDQPRLAIELRRNAHGVVDYVADIDRRKKKGGRPNQGTRIFEALVDLYRRNPGGIALDTIVQEAIDRGVLCETDGFPAAWRARRQVVKAHLCENPKVDQRPDGTFALMPGAGK